MSNDLSCLLQNGYYLNGTKLGLSFPTQKSQGKCMVSSLKEKMKWKFAQYEWILLSQYNQMLPKVL